MMERPPALFVKPYNENKYIKISHDNPVEEQKMLWVVVRTLGRCVIVEVAPFNANEISYEEFIGK